MSYWNTLTHEWQKALKQAFTTYFNDGSAPIGCVITDDRGVIVSSGRKAYDRRLAHAEMNALNGLTEHVDRPRLSLYSTLEPCPMCTGAIRMSQVGTLHFAAYDPSGGSTRFLQANEFMKAFPCSVVAPRDPVLEFVVTTLVMEHRLRTGFTRWLAKWEGYHPAACAIARQLVDAGAYEDWRRAGVPPKELYDGIAGRMPDDA